MKRPISLFGVETKTQSCFFIHHEGLGYWFIANKQRTVGEFIELGDVTNKIERMEIDNTLLVLDICTQNKIEVVGEYISTLSDEETKKIIKKELQEKLFSTDTNLKIEFFVKELLSSGDVQHPILYPYRDRIVSRLSNNMMFDYQVQVVKCAFKHRLVLEEKYIVVDNKDSEKGFLSVEDIKKHQIIGEPNPSLEDIGEQLTMQIYQFTSNDFAGKDWLTSKMKVEIINQEKEVDKNIPTPDEEDSELETITDEKKLAVLTSSES